MEIVNYTSGILWLMAWPILIYGTYRFTVLNINHFEEFIKNR